MNNTISNIDISIIIVNYKSWSDLKKCLFSIQKIGLQKVSIEVVVIDNYSNDNQLKKFKKKFTEFKFIENTGNNGFANGCNLGAKNARGKYLFFLNPDTIISEAAILKIYSYLKENKKVGIVSCNQRNNNDTYEKRIRFFPEFNTLFGVLRAVNKRNLISKIVKKNEVIFPDWVSGAVVFISRSWFNKINGWNEDYWMYFEDIDLAKKVCNLDGKIALLTNTEIIHNHGGASRINIKTATITKTEVLISKHVYINNHFTGTKHAMLQFLVIVNNLVTKTVLAILGFFLFFIPKLRLNVYLYINLIKYYLASIKNKTWLSFRSMNHTKKRLRNEY